MKVNKIAMICNRLSGGGAEAVMKTLCQLFAERGKSIDFLTPYSGGMYEKEVSQYSNLIKLNTKTRYLVPKLYHYLKTNKPDVILSTQSHINIATIIAAKMSGVKSVVREATTPSIAFAKKNPKLRIPVKLTYPLANKIISVSEGVKRDLIENFKINENIITTIYNPIVSSDLYVKANEEIEHPWFKNEIPVIVSMGRFAKAKDYPTLIKAFRLIREKINCKLIILGDTDRDLEVKKEVNELIQTFGLINDIDLVGFKKNPFPYIKKCSLYILSSIYEGLPGALIQAVALGCKVISTDCQSGPKEILNDGEFGTLVETKDFKSIATEAVKILSKESKTLEVPNSFTDKYTENGICNEYLQLFESTVLNE